MKKAISPLISWILLVGMVVAMGTMVSIFLINQAKETGKTIKKSQYEELYCPDVAVSGQDLCYIEQFQGNNFKLNLSLKNRGAFSIHNLIFSTVPIGILGEYAMDPPENIPLIPNEKINLLFVADLRAVTFDGDKIIDHGLQEIMISPEIVIEGETVLCNQKIFKLETSNYDIPICT